MLVYWAGVVDVGPTLKQTFGLIYRAYTVAKTQMLGGRLRQRKSLVPADTQ